MKNKRLIVYGVLVFIIGIVIGGFMIILSNNSKPSKPDNNATVNENSHEKVASGYSLETTDKNVINKELKGEYLDSMVTIALKQDEFSINLKGIDSNSEVFLINPGTGDMNPMKYSDGKFSVKAKLETDITYGIIINYKLSGSIRVVNDLNTIDKDQLYRDILISMGCGL